MFPDDAYVAASRAGVLEAGKHLESISEVLRDIRPMPAAFVRKYARNLEGQHIKEDIEQTSDAATRFAKTSTVSVKTSRSTVW